MKKRLLKLGKQSAIVALSILTFSGVGYVFAQPTVAPNGGAGVALPLNTGSDPQTKAGDLAVTGSLSAPTICLAGDCQTEWPSGGGNFQTVAINHAGYISGTCNGNIYSTQTFWNYGSGPQTYQVSHCSIQPESVTLVNAVPGGGVLVNASLVVWCHSSSNNWSVYGAPIDYVTDSYYTSRSQGASVSAVVSGADLIVTATCPYIYGGNYTYRGMKITGDVLISN